MAEKVPNILLLNDLVQPITTSLTTIQDSLEQIELASSPIVAIFQDNSPTPFSG